MTKQEKRSNWMIYCRQSSYCIYCCVEFEIVISTVAGKQVWSQRSKLLGTKM